MDEHLIKKKYPSLRAVLEFLFVFAIHGFVFGLSFYQVKMSKTSYRYLLPTDAKSFSRNDVMQKLLKKIKNTKAKKAMSFKDIAIARKFYYHLKQELKLERSPIRSGISKEEDLFFRENLEKLRSQISKYVVVFVSSLLRKEDITYKEARKRIITLLDKKAPHIPEGHYLCLDKKKPQTCQSGEMLVLSHMKMRMMTGW